MHKKEIIITIIIQKLYFIMSW